MWLKDATTNVSKPVLGNGVHQWNNYRLGHIQVSSQDVLKDLDSGPGIFEFLLGVE